MIKRHLITGLAILFPMVMTILIMTFFLNLLTKPFQDIIKDVIRYYGFSGTSEQFLLLFSKGIVIIFLFTITVITGFFARLVITRYFISIGNKVIDKIPIVNKIYKATQEAVTTLLSDDKTTFSQVVLVPFPHEGAYSIGLVTNDNIAISSDAEHEGFISVFVPATPNPTMGFMLMLERKELIFIDMKIDDALKTIISCGVMFKEGSQING